MGKIVDFKAYKTALKYSKDLITILKILNATTKALNRYKHYKLVKEILKEIGLRKSVLELYNKKYQKILDNKGIVDENQVEETKGKNS